VIEGARWKSSYVHRQNEFDIDFAELIAVIKILIDSIERLRVETHAPLCHQAPVVVGGHIVRARSDLIWPRLCIGEYCFTLYQQRVLSFAGNYYCREWSFYLLQWAFYRMAGRFKGTLERSVASDTQSLTGYSLAFEFFFLDAYMPICFSVYCFFVREATLFV